MLGIALERELRRRALEPDDREDLAGDLEDGGLLAERIGELRARLARTGVVHRRALGRSSADPREVRAHDAGGVLVARQAERIGSRRAPVRRPGAHDRHGGRIDLDRDGRERRRVHERVQRVQQLAAS